MKKSLIIIIISCFLASNLDSQNRMWGALTSYVPLRGKDIKHFYNTNLIGDDYSVQYFEDSLDFPDFGRFPSGKLIVNALNDKLYTPFISGNCTDNYILEFNIDSSVISKAFMFEDNYFPVGNILEYSSGIIYGLAIKPDNSINTLVLYKLNTQTSEFDSIANINSLGIQDFSLLTKHQSKISMIVASDGNIYGNTLQGGYNDLGFIFMYDINNNTLVKKLNFNTSNNPNGYLFLTRNNDIYLTCNDKVSSYDYTNNTLNTVFQSTEENIPDYLCEGYNNDFYGYLDYRYLVKLDFNNNTSSVIFDSYDFPLSPWAFAQGYLFYGYPTFTSNGNMIGFAIILVKMETFFYDEIIFSMELEYENHYSIEQTYHTGIPSRFYNMNIEEVCYPQSININKIILNSDSIFLQDSYQNTSGYYYDTLSNFCGKDSIIISHLIIADILNIDTITICKGETVYFNQEQITESGLYYESFSTLSGDSVVALEVIVNPTYYIDNYYSICANDSILFAGSYYGIGDYQINFNSVNYCDSIYNLHVSSLTAEPNIVLAQDSDSLVIGNQYSFYAGYLNDGNYYNWSTIPSSSIISEDLVEGNYQCGIVFLENVNYSVKVVAHNQCGDFSDTMSISFLNDSILIYNDLVLYPNPTYDNLYFYSSDITLLSLVEIYDITGRLVYAKSIDHDNKLNISSLSSGIYHVVIYTENNHVFKKKIVKLEMPE